MVESNCPLSIPLLPLPNWLVQLAKLVVIVNKIKQIDCAFFYFLDSYYGIWCMIKKLNISFPKRFEVFSPTIKIGALHPL